MHRICMNMETFLCQNKYLDGWWISNDKIQSWLLYIKKKYCSLSGVVCQACQEAVVLPNLCRCQLPHQWTFSSRKWSDKWWEPTPGDWMPTNSQMPSRYESTLETLFYTHEWLQLHSCGTFICLRFLIIILIEIVKNIICYYCSIQIVVHVFYKWIYLF